MIRPFAICGLAGMSWALAATAPAASPAPPRQDLLRFVNGDQLHGSFQGVKTGPVAVWQRPDLTAPGEFKSNQIQKIILRAGRPEKSNESLTHIALVNGDRIPGTLSALDDETCTVDTSIAGVLHIPRKNVGMIAPMPLGGRVLYHGTYAEDGWLMTHPDFPDGIPELTAAANPAPDPAPPMPDAAGDDEAGEAPDPVKNTPIPRWDFSGAAWYWNHKQGATALVRKTGMTERSMLRFNLAWRSRLMLCIAFHADFSHPKQAEPNKDDNPRAAGNLNALANAKKRALMNHPGPGDPSALPKLFGNSYVLQVNSGFAMLLRCGYDADGKPTMERLQINNPSIRLPESGSAAFDLRCDRIKGTIVLHIDGELAMQWDEPGRADTPPYAGKGAGIGFLVQMENSPVRISDVVIAEWNGMPDSARSMQLDDQDIVLLANGTDRFSGKVVDFHDGKLRLLGKFGDFSFPLDAIAEVRFASNSQAKPEPSNDPRVIVRLDPIGNISGIPLSGDAASLKLLTPYAGTININLQSATILDFQPSNNLLDDWDPQF
jgi:hypothetical protein